MTSDESKQRFPTKYLVILGATSLIIFVAPCMRRYESYGRSDSMGHVRYILDIVAERRCQLSVSSSTHTTKCVFLGFWAPSDDLGSICAGVRVSDVLCGLYLLAGHASLRGKVACCLCYSACRLSFLPFMWSLALSFSASLMPFLVYLWIRACHSSRPILWRNCWVTFCLGVSLFRPLFALLVVAALVGWSCGSGCSVRK